MRKLLCVLLLCSMLGCINKPVPCDEQVKIQVTKIIENVQCSIPVRPQYNLLNTDNYIAEKTNAYIITRNTILMDKYMQELEITVDCFNTTFKKFKEIE